MCQGGFVRVKTPQLLLSTGKVFSKWKEEGCSLLLLLYPRTTELSDPAFQNGWEWAEEG